jgi:thiol-disulfide isomerase/thioredoxin
MANNSSSKSSSKGNNPSGKRNASSKKSGSKSPLIFVTLAIVVALAAVVALRAGKHGSSSSSDTLAPSQVANQAQQANQNLEKGDPGEYQPVSLVGDHLPAFDQSIGDKAIGMSAPTFTGYSFDGSPIGYAGGDGTPTMIVFLAHWCPHCNAEVPRLVQWYKSGLKPKALRIIGITTSSRNDAPNWPPSTWLTKTMAWPWESMADSQTSDAASAFGVTGFPAIILLNGAGKVEYRLSGEVPIDELDSVIKGALNLL